MHGLGNDFVILNHEDLRYIKNLSSLAKKISDRRLGIGADQMIIYKKHKSYYDMIIYNQDGSKACNCGNAARCLAKLMYLNYGVKEIILKILDRKLKCQVHNEQEISVNMGDIIFDASWMPEQTKLYKFAQRYMIDDQEIICADAGNPHIVIFSNLSEQDEEVIGSQLQKDKMFPDGINVNFAQIDDNKIKLKVWERGTGFTLACGSGACATYGSAKRLGFITDDAEVIFALGKLKMHTDHGVIMTGPATIVAIGKFYYS